MQQQLQSQSSEVATSERDFARSLKSKVATGKTSGFDFQIVSFFFERMRLFLHFANFQVLFFGGVRDKRFLLSCFYYMRSHVSRIVNDNLNGFQMFRARARLPPSHLHSLLFGRGSPQAPAPGYKSRHACECVCVCVCAFDMLRSGSNFGCATRIAFLFFPVLYRGPQVSNPDARRAHFLLVLPSFLIVYWLSRPSRASRTICVAAFVAFTFCKGRGGHQHAPVCACVVRVANEFIHAMKILALMIHRYVLM